jgi:hypothetical protein
MPPFPPPPPKLNHLFWWYFIEPYKKKHKAKQNKTKKSQRINIAINIYKLDVINISLQISNTNSKAINLIHKTLICSLNPHFYLIQTEPS